MSDLLYPLLHMYMYIHSCKHACVCIYICIYIGRHEWAFVCIHVHKCVCVSITGNEDTDTHLCLLFVHQEMTGQSNLGMEVPVTGGADVRSCCSGGTCHSYFLLEALPCCLSYVPFFSNCCSSRDKYLPGNAV